MLKINLKIEKYPIYYISIIYLIGLIFFCYFSNLFISGPFIFADEAEYHWLASQFFNFQKSYAHQYGPLYPILIAPTFLIEKLATHFYLIKYLNLAFYLSIIYPIYLLAREIKFSVNVAILLSAVAVISPISAYAYVIWADPIYYVLISWSYYFLTKYLVNKRFVYIFLFGLFIGFSYLAKQAALILSFSFIAVVFVSRFKKFNRVDIKSFALMLLGVGLIVLPWIARNKYVGESAIGYSSMFSLLLTTFKADPFKLATEIIGGIGYSAGYWIYEYLGAGFFLLLILIFHRNDKSNLEECPRLLASIVLMHSLLLMFFSEIFLVAYDKTSSANGRYVDVIYPIAFILIIWTVINIKRINYGGILLIGLASFIITFVFSPLTQVEAYGAVNNSAASLLNIFWPNEFVWVRKVPTFQEKLILSIVISLLTVIILLLNRRSIWVLCLCSLILGVGSQVQVLRLGSTSNPINKVFTGLDEYGISGDDLLIDNSFMGDSSILFHYGFWYQKRSEDINIFANPINIMKTISIDYGVQEKVEINKNSLKLWAPWNPETGFNEVSGAGFGDIKTLNAGNCSPSVQGDFIFDQNPSTFTFKLPPGKYTLNGKSGNSACLGLKSNFSIEINGGRDIYLDGESNFAHQFEVTKEGGALSMHLNPKPKSIWSLDEISIKADNINLPEKHSEHYFLSKRWLPLTKVFSVSDYKVYKIE